MAEQGTRREVNVVADADVGGICKDGMGPDAAIFAYSVKVAVPTEKFCVFFGTRVTELNLKTRELAVTHGKMADNFLQG